MPVFWSKSSIKSKIFFFLSSEVGLSVTTTNEGLFDEALIKPQEPSLKVNLIPFTVDRPTSFAFAGPDQFKYDTSIDIFTAYKYYIRSKPWVSSNYLRDPSRKPSWV